jgi:hypothetical protein
LSQSIPELPDTPSEESSEQGNTPAIGEKPVVRNETPEKHEEDVCFVFIFNHHNLLYIIGTKNHDA